jgi:hypothetical protein
MLGDLPHQSSPVVVPDWNERKAMARPSNQTHTPNRKPLRLQSFSLSHRQCRC